MTLSDVFVRRIRVSITAEHGGVDAAPRVAELLAPLLGWSSERVDDEVERYRAEIDRDRSALMSDGGSQTP